MKLTIKQPALLELVQFCSSIVEKRSTVPVLSNALFSAKEGKLKVAATDLEVFLTATVDCEVETEGETTLSVKQLHEILRELPAGEKIVIQAAANSWIELTAGKARFQLVALPARDFPTVPDATQVAQTEVDADVLQEMIDKTSFSVSTDETRYHLNGVYFTCVEVNGRRGLRMVSTDGHRMSLIDRELEKSEAPGMGKGIIIPRKGVTEIRKLLSDMNGPLKIGMDENRCIVSRGSVTLQIRLIEGEFPDYRKVIPRGNDKKLQLPRELFLASLKRVSLMSNDASKTVTLSVHDGVMEIRSNNPNVGEAREDMEVDYHGENLKIGFNARYFIDVLSAMNTPDVQLSLKDQLSPGMIQSPKDETYTAVVMPMRI